MSSEHNVEGFWPVFVALTGNLLITVSKFIGWFFTGSVSMLSEAIHSLADTGTQGLLMLGIKRAQKKPTDEFCYGFGQERFFWALVSACFMLSIGSGVTIYHSVHALLVGETPEENIWNFIILGVSLVIETFSLVTVIVSIKKKHPDLSFWQAVRKSDPITLAILLEDSVACLGLFLAFVGNLLTHLTGSYYWDTLASLLIGIMLGVTAVLLIYLNRKYLIDMAMPIEEREKVLDFLHSLPLINGVDGFKSAYTGPDEYRLTMEIRPNIPFVETMVGANAAVSAVVGTLGKEVDRVKTAVKEKFPQVRFLKIEICA